MRRPWRKLHLGRDAGTDEVVAPLLTADDADDGAQIDPLLDQINGPLASFAGDGAPASVAVRHPEATIIVPPRSNAVLLTATEVEVAVHTLNRMLELGQLCSHP